MSTKRGDTTTKSKSGFDKRGAMAGESSSISKIPPPKKSVENTAQKVPKPPIIDQMITKPVQH